MASNVDDRAIDAGFAAAERALREGLPPGWTWSLWHGPGRATLQVSRRDNEPPGHAKTYGIDTPTDRLSDAIRAAIRHAHNAELRTAEDAPAAEGARPAEAARVAPAANVDADGWAYYQTTHECWWRVRGNLAECGYESHAFAVVPGRAAEDVLQWVAGGYLFPCRPPEWLSSSPAPAPAANVEGSGWSHWISTLCHWRGWLWRLKGSAVHVKCIGDRAWGPSGVGAESARAKIAAGEWVPAEAAAETAGAR